MNDNLSRVPSLGTDLPGQNIKENIQVDKSIIGFGLSFAVVSIFNGLLVILKETVDPIMNWMASLMGHHWITHGIFDLVLFLILGYFFSRKNIQKTLPAEKMSYLIIGSTVIGVIIIVGFNLFR